MPEYIYILSNPSMPGLVKIGKTTTSPQQRMAELSSTGVPTPFVLELSLEVDDCHASEYAAHVALEKYRVARNREFFRISVPEAISQILPVIGAYKIHIVQEAHGIVAIEEELNRRKAEAERLESDRRDAIRRRSIQERRILEKRKVEIEAAIRAQNFKLRQLGPRPQKKELPGIATFFWLAYMPVPIGWVAWLGALRIFDSDGQDMGLLCISLIIAGYIASHFEKDYEEDYSRLASPFAPIDNRLRELESELNSVRTSLSQISVEPSSRVPVELVNLPNNPVPTTRWSTESTHTPPKHVLMNKKIIICTFCGEVSEHDDVHMVTCPRCKTTIFTR